MGYYAETTESTEWRNRLVLQSQSPTVDAEHEVIPVSRFPVSGLVKDYNQ